MALRQTIIRYSATFYPDYQAPTTSGQVSLYPDLIRSDSRSQLIVGQSVMRGDEPNLHGKIDENDAQAVSPEKQEEMKLMNKLASSGGLPAKGPSSFLQKRLQHRKFFDSGDYAMDKAKKGSGATTTPSRGGVTPMTIIDSGSLSVVVADEHMEARSPSPIDAIVGDTPSTGLEIPRPETVPQRKSSIIYPSAHSKLSPQPHLHHSSSDAQDTL